MASVHTDGSVVIETPEGIPARAVKLTFSKMGEPVVIDGLQVSACQHGRLLCSNLYNLLISELLGIERTVQCNVKRFWVPVLIL